MPAQATRMSMRPSALAVSVGGALHGCGVGDVDA